MKFRYAIRLALAATVLGALAGTVEGQDLKKGLLGELKEYAKEKAKEYAKDKAVETTIDRVFQSKELDDIVSFSLSCKGLTPGCLYTVFLEGEVLGDATLTGEGFRTWEAARKAKIERIQACNDFLNNAFPVWEGKRTAVSKAVKEQQDRTKKLVRRIKAHEVEREQLKNDVEGFTRSAQAEEEALNTERDRLMRTRDEVKASLAREQDAIKSAAQAFATSDVAKKYAYEQEAFRRLFEYRIKIHPGYADVTKRHLDHLNRTGDLLPDRPPWYIEVPGVPTWANQAQINNRANQQFKDGKKSIEDRIAALKERARAQSEKLTNEATAYGRRVNSLNDRSSAIKERVSSFNEAARQLSSVINNHTRERDAVLEKLRGALAADRLILRCIAVLEKSDAPASVRWRTKYEKVLSSTRFDVVADE